VTRLRKLMLDELQRRNYSQNTVRSYIHAVEDFAKYFRRPPDQEGRDTTSSACRTMRDHRESPAVPTPQTANSPRLDGPHAAATVTKTEIKYQRCRARRKRERLSSNGPSKLPRR
jgi:hypothetical protein